MHKTTFYPKLVISFMLSFTLFFLFSCASTPVKEGSEMEPWVGKFTGMVKADIKMFFSRSEEEEGVYFVKGTFSGDIEKVAGSYGSGEMTGTIKGKIKDGIVNIKLFGSASGDWSGAVPISGKMLGTLSKTQAFGTWEIRASDLATAYLFTGDWSAEKIDSDSAGK